jgi:hypothetical protein
MDTLELTFEFERSTKNTHRYREVGSEDIGVVYIQKESLPANPPKKLLVTVEEGK